MINHGYLKWDLQLSVKNYLHMYKYITDSKKQSIFYSQKAMEFSSTIIVK